MDVLFLLALARLGMCLPSSCLAMGIQVTTYISVKSANCKLLATKPIAGTFYAALRHTVVLNYRVLLVRFLLSLFFNPEDGCNIFLRNAVRFYRTTRHYSPEDILHRHRCGNLKSNRLFLFVRRPPLCLTDIEYQRR
jgi:hypothetical protein